TATYNVPAPGGTFDVADNGTYTVAVQANQVFNTGGNPVAAGTLGTFVVAVPTIFTVSNTNDAGAGSLRQAITDANTLTGADVIVFDSSFNTAKTITLTSGELLVSDSVTITGPGAGLLTVRRDVAAATQFRIFDV